MSSPTNLTGTEQQNHDMRNPNCWPKDLNEHYSPVLPKNTEHFFFYLRGPLLKSLIKPIQVKAIIAEMTKSTLMW